MDFTDLYKSTVARKHVASWKPCGLVQHLWTHELNEQHLTSYVTHKDSYITDGDIAMTNGIQGSPMNSFFCFIGITESTSSQQQPKPANIISKFANQTIFTWGNHCHLQVFTHRLGFLRFKSSLGSPQQGLENGGTFGEGEVLVG